LFHTEKQTLSTASTCRCRWTRRRVQIVRLPRSTPSSQEFDNYCKATGRRGGKQLSRYLKNKCA